jgi:uncharacterized protein (TIGR04222 family)
MWVLLVLLVAAAGIANAAKLLRGARSHGGDLAGPDAAPKDPRALAWLRGGDANLALLAAYDLARRGFLAVVEKNGKPTTKLARTELAPEVDRLSPLETAILLFFDQPRSLHALLMDDKVLARAREVGRETRACLVSLGLAVPRDVNLRRAWVLLGYVAALAVVAASALFWQSGWRWDALAGMVFGVAGTAALTILGLTMPVRLTGAGRRLLQASEVELDSSRLKLLYQAQTDIDFVRLRATYGWDVPLGSQEGNLSKPFAGMDHWI